MMETARFGAGAFGSGVSPPTAGVRGRGRRGAAASRAPVGARA